MKYIHFVIICICMLFLCISPAAGVKTKAMIHYSEPEVSIEDKISLEQGYSLKIQDMNSNTGDIWIELYLNGKEVDLDDNFAKEDEPLEYVRTVVENEGEDDEIETDYFILSITPEGSVKTSGGDAYSTIYIEQYLDPAEDADDYLILDKSYSLKTGSELELDDLYTIEVADVDDDEVTLELRYDGRLLRDDEVEEGKYFYYSIYSDKGPTTIFLANVKGFFETDDGVIVFLNHLSLKEGTVAVETDTDTDIPESLDLDVLSPVGGGLKAGRVAIIDYYLDDSYSEVSIFVDGDVLDSRNKVGPGAYKAVTDKLDAGVHKVTLVTVDDNDDVAYHSEEFTVSVDIKDNITESIAELASTATESFEKDNSSNVSAGLSKPLLSSDVSNILSLIVTAVVFVVFIWFFKKFL